jgi:alcohol dehydrogenase (NADP+)
VKGAIHGGGVILNRGNKKIYLLLLNTFGYTNILHLMKKFQFTNNGTMPALGLGTWKSSPGEVYSAVREGIKTGYRHFDCAYIYGNEREIGKALSDAMAAGEVKREYLFITSKLWNDRHGRDRVAGGIEKSLRDLRLEYLDLYLIHWPVAFRPVTSMSQMGDELISLEEIPLAETWAGMEAILAAGKTRHIGVSNFSIQKLDALIASAAHLPEVNQVEMHPLLQQSELKEYCDGRNIILTAYSPLGSKDRPVGLRKDNEPSLLENAVIMDIAQDMSCTPAQVLLSWAIERGTSVISKTIQPERLKENLEAVDITLPVEAMTLIAELDRHYRFIDGTFWTGPDSPYTLNNLWDE